MTRRVKTKAFLASEVPQTWHLVDASGQVLGRMAARVAALLRGKHKPTFTPNQNMGDSVIVINAAQVVLTGKKKVQKIYHRHTGYIGGLKSISAGTLQRERPDRMVTWAITGMLPKNKLGRAMAKRLRVYAGPTHPHGAQIQQMQKKVAPTGGAAVEVVSAAAPAERQTPEGNG